MWTTVIGQAELKADEHSLEDFQQTKGAEAVARALEAMPALRRYSLKLVPIGRHTVLELTPDQIQQRATRLASWACGQRGSNVGSNLDRLWAERHQTITEPSASQAEHGQHPSSKCADAGVCLCTGAGLGLKQLHNALLRMMKRRFQGKAKQELADGLYTLRLFADRASEDSALPAAEGSHDEEHILHLSLMYWKPYRPTFHKLVRSERPKGEADFPAEWVYVQAHCLVALALY